MTNMKQAERVADAARGRDSARAAQLVGAAAGHSPLLAMRTELGIVGTLLATAGAAWWWTAERMAGMDGAPGAALGSVGWFTGVWATMMAAMMLPSLAPAAASLSPARRRELTRLTLFVAGYLTVWSAAGVAAYGLFGLGRALIGGWLAWHSGGRAAAGGVLVLAALYQLTPLKIAFLSRCRKPPRAGLDHSWHGSRRQAFASGLRNGGWCLGSSWALMAALFALGVMSLVWMALIALLVALEKIGPQGPAPRLATAAVMAVLAIAILAVPRELPGFDVPAQPAQSQAMRAMG